MVPVEFYDYLGSSFLAAIAVQLVAFTVAMYRKRVDVVDVAWGLSFIAIVMSLFAREPSPGTGALIVTVLVVIWGSRLAWHIGRRFIHSSVQDERYTELMRRWPTGYRPLQVFARIFLVQAMLATVISLPIIVIYSFNPGVGILTIAGSLVWIAGFIIEAVADRQLKLFIQTAKPGELMQSGLWRYSRHPNYFGEITMWWGIAIISLTTPLWWLGVVGSLVITILIVFISGIPPSEARAATRKGWAGYKRRTGALVPRFQNSDRR